MMESGELSAIVCGQPMMPRCSAGRMVTRMALLSGKLKFDSSLSLSKPKNMLVYS
jgi:hypothetical protein